MFLRLRRKYDTIIKETDAVTATSCKGNSGIPPPALVVGNELVDVVKVDGSEGVVAVELVVAVVVEAGMLVVLAVDDVVVAVVTAGAPSDTTIWWGP